MPTTNLSVLSAAIRLVTRTKEQFSSCFALVAAAVDVGSQGRIALNTHLMIERCLDGIAERRRGGEWAKRGQTS